jgi:hypothetical protein
MPRGQLPQNLDFLLATRLGLRTTLGETATDHDGTRLWYAARDLGQPLTAPSRRRQYLKQTPGVGMVCAAIELLT